MASIPGETENKIQLSRYYVSQIEQNAILTIILRERIRTSVGRDLVHCIRTSEVKQRCTIRRTESSKLLRATFRLFQIHKTPRRRIRYNSEGVRTQIITRTIAL